MDPELIPIEFQIEEDRDHFPEPTVDELDALEREYPWEDDLAQYNANEADDYRDET